MIFTFCFNGLTRTKYMYDIQFHTEENGPSEAHPYRILLKLSRRTLIDKRVQKKKISLIVKIIFPIELVE
jgi:hypothetical protein